MDVMNQMGIRFQPVEVLLACREVGESPVLGSSPHHHCVPARAVQTPSLDALFVETRSLGAKGTIRTQEKGASGTDG